MEILIDKISDVIKPFLTRILKPITFLLTPIIQCQFLIGSQLKSELNLIK